jgi:hypothetical protein
MQWWVPAAAAAMAAAAWLSQGGGTLVMHLPDNPVQPIGISVRGPVEREVTLLRYGVREVVVRGLPPGRYDISPTFTGTVSGPTTVVQLVEGSGTTVALPISQVGGIRFDADSGMCEPGFEFSFIPLAIHGGARPSPVPVGGVPLPTSTSCQQEIAGLSPGTYRVRIIPPRHVLPEYYALVRIEPSAWTTHRIAFPPVVVRGRVTSNGEPVPGVQVVIRPMALPPLTGVRPGSTLTTFDQSVTDADGRYILGLSAPGVYRQTLRETGQADTPGIRGEVDLRLGVNDNDLEVGGGTLRVWLTERGAVMAPDRTVALTVQSLPQLPKRPTVTNPSEPFEMRLITPGRYVVSATARTVDAGGRPVTLVAAQQKEVVIVQSGTVDVSIDLIQREETWLEVAHADGAPAEGAYVIPHPGAPSLRADERGRVALETVPVGTRLPIRTRMWGITCHTVTHAAFQRVVVPDATETLVLTWTQNNNVTMGRQALGGSIIDGMPGATCALPFEALSVGESRVAGRVDFKVQLPRGVYTLTLLDGRTITVTAPGRYDIP